MHCLEVIVARNERAAAREEAHAANDGDWSLAKQICDAAPVTPQHAAAYNAARRDG